MTQKRLELSQRAFFHWLNAEHENDQRYNLAKSQIHPTTCSWIIHTEEYRAWAQALEPDFPTQVEDDPCPVLEIQGGEGCGKTTLAAWLTEDLDAKTKKRKAAFAYYFHESDARHSNDDRATLAAFIAQILRKNRPLLDAELVKLLKASYNTIASEDECYGILHRLIQHFDLVVVLIDSRHAFLNSRFYEILCRLMGKDQLEKLNSNHLDRENGAQPGILLKGIFLSETNDWPGWYQSKNTRVLEISHQNQAGDEQNFVVSKAEAVCSLHYQIQQPEWRLLRENRLGLFTPPFLLNTPPFLLDTPPQGPILVFVTKLA